MGLVRRQMDHLTHWGIPGQKWGVRRWQYPDGRFTEEGKERYFRIGDASRSAKNAKSSGIFKRTINGVTNSGLGVISVGVGGYKAIKNSQKIIGNKMNIGKEVVKYALMGKVGAEQYNIDRYKLNAGRGKAAVDAILVTPVMQIATLGARNSKIANKYGLIE
jgi:hypothetical protein